MDPSPTASLKTLGREAARQVAGESAVKEVEVVAGDDAERPVYVFRFLIDQDSARQRAGLLRTRLIQKLRDDLLARNDARHPLVQILSEADWNKRKGA